jgi:fluoride ion exporter CrcB/FEX
VALGSVVGSVGRQTAETGQARILQDAPLHVRLLVAAGGSFVSGFLAAYDSPLGPGNVMIPQTPADDLIGGLLVGLFGGFVILPALVADHAPVIPAEADAQRIIASVVSSLVVAIAFFLLGALLYRFPFNV